MASQTKILAVREKLIMVVAGIGRVAGDALIRDISYGKERPFGTKSTESCWQTNRRAGFSFGLWSNVCSGGRSCAVGNSQQSQLGCKDDYRH